MSLWLTAMGAEVTGLSLPPATEPSLFELAGLAEHADSRFGSIVDARPVDRVLADARPTVIMHLAAQSLVRASYDDPVATFATNVVGTVQRARAARRAADLGPSSSSPATSATRTASGTGAIGRRTRWAATTPTPRARAAPSSSPPPAPFVLRSRGPRTIAGTVGRSAAGNVIGGGDWADDRLIPDIVRAIGAGEDVVIRRPDAVRPWQHVLEPLAGYLLLAERLAAVERPRVELRSTGPRRAVGRLDGGPDGPAVGWRRKLAVRARTGPMRRRCSSSTAPRPGTASGGVPGWASTRPSTG